jgi:hypothetical protein
MRSPAGRKLQLRAYAVRLNFSEAQLRIAAECQVHPLAQHRKPGTESAGFLDLQPDPCVRHSHVAAAIAQPHVDIDASTLFSRIDPVTHGILHQREQRHRRTRQHVCRRIDVQRELQAVGDAHLHELEIGTDQIQLLSERRAGLVHARHAARR